MNARLFVAVIQALAFLLAVVGVLSILGQAWDYIPFWQKTLVGFYLIVGFSGVMIAIWVYEDGEELAQIREELAEMRGGDPDPRETNTDKDRQYD